MRGLVAAVGHRTINPFCLPLMWNKSRARNANSLSPTGWPPKSAYMRQLMVVNGPPDLTGLGFG